MRARARARARGSYYMGVAMKLLYGRKNLHRIVRGLGPGLSTNPRQLLILSRALSKMLLLPLVQSLIEFLLRREPYVV